MDGNKENKETNFEDLLRKVGSKNRFQIIIFICCEFLEASTASCVLYFIFEGANPGWVCHDNDFDKHAGKKTTGELCPDNGSCKNVTFSNAFTSIVTEVSKN